jgi:hypothetical protein
VNTLQLKVREKKSKETGKSQWEATATIPGLRPAKVTKRDGQTTFGTKTSLLKASEKVAKSLGFSGVSWDDPKAKKDTTVKSAAKRSTKRSTKRAKKASPKIALPSSKKAKTTKRVKKTKTKKK